jgi:hypothetical protein
MYSCREIWWFVAGRPGTGKMWLQVYGTVDKEYWKETMQNALNFISCELRINSLFKRSLRANIKIHCSNFDSASTVTHT